MHDELCTVPQVAEILKIGPTKAWELVRTGRLKSVSLGKSRRVPRSAIEEFIDHLKQEAALTA
jgi:excisionase family DNA binding protein